MARVFIILAVSFEAHAAAAAFMSKIHPSKAFGLGDVPTRLANSNKSSFARFEDAQSDVLEVHMYSCANRMQARAAVPLESQKYHHRERSLPKAAWMRRMHMTTPAPAESSNFAPTLPYLPRPETPEEHLPKASPPCR